VYFAFAVFTTIVLPLASVLVALAAEPAADPVLEIGRWFVFWGIGVRLAVAGLSQVARPAATSAGILGIADPAAGKVVAELGFANIAMGTVALLSLPLTAWTTPAALAGGMFIAAAGVKHVFNPGRSFKENTAMVTDLVVAAAVGLYLAGLALR
jgi:hypothetical protein